MYHLTTLITLFNVNYASFNKIYSLVSAIWKFKKLKFKTSVSKMRTPIGYWTSWQWRQIWDLGVNCPQTNKISENFMIRDSICVSSCCSEYIATRMPTNCWTDAVANCANNNSMFTSWLMWCLSQMRTVFMAALWNRAGHHIFALWFLSSSFFFFLA